MELLLLGFVSSTELGRLAITWVRVTRRLAMPESYHGAEGEPEREPVKLKKHCAVEII